MKKPGTCWHDVSLDTWCNACAIEGVESAKRETQDAARYRWLRDIGADTIFMKEPVSFMSGDQLIHVKQIGWTELDKAIDAAIAREQLPQVERSG